MDRRFRVVHYVNQFFAGLGGEERANHPLEVRTGPVGPGQGLAKELAEVGDVIATLVCGDNYFQENPEKAREGVAQALRELKPDVVVAGPAFSAGRYGLACGEVCKVAMNAGIPALTAMHTDNPGVLMYRHEVVIVPTSATPSEMAQALQQLARLATKMARGEELGPAEVEGYLPRGIRKPGFRDLPGYLRGVEMLLAKLNGRPYQTEVSYQAPEHVPPAPPVQDLSRATVALITTGGLVPKGNPDGQTAGNARRYFRYSVEHLERLSPDDWEAFHAGYFTHIASSNPDYILPLGFAREFAAEGVIGGVYPYIYTLPGVSTPVAQSQELGRGVARELKEGKVDFALLVST